MEFKICSNPKCNKEKPLSDFYKHSQMKDGHLNKCKECVKEAANNHRSANLEKIREYDRGRASLPHRRKLNTKTTKRMREDLPHVYKAHSALNYAVKIGKITKPTICSVCHKEKKLHGHHDDYTKPLDVEWMCVVCHRAFRKDLDNN